MHQYIIMVTVGENSYGKTIPLCQLGGENEEIALHKLKERLSALGIETTIFMGRWLRWNHVYFWIQRIKPFEELPNMVGVVRQLDSDEERSLRQFERLVTSGHQ